MRTVRVAMSFPATVHEAESCWYDAARWPDWVDGLDRIVALSADWPRVGAGVDWESGPAGRGSVHERVIAHEPLVGQQLEVRDDSIQGRQSVAFTPVDGGVEVALTLEYRITRRSVFMPVIDFLFVGRAMAASMGTTLARFGAELASRREAAGASPRPPVSSAGD
jgi:hypothetical protein